MCQCEEAENQTTNHLLFHCKKLHNQRTDMIKELKNTGGDWPVTNETLVDDYLKVFIKLVKSIDFKNL
jgi:hypothetical protein